MSLKNDIAVEARRLGFSLFGVLEPNTPQHYEVYERWIAQGKHGEMGYLETERALAFRKDPKLVLAECQSILVVGWPHTPPSLSPLEMEIDRRKPRGRIAAYAWSEDYHDVIPNRLKELVGFIENHVGRPVPNRWYTDTGPILERDMAQRAGLGWIGKNTCLINPQQGSFFLLAEIFLGITLEPDIPFSVDRCGTCTRCIEACPTACIQADRTIDASRCISYLTIEIKGAIARDLRPQLGNWVFGCDICQLVCPWNQRFAQQDRSDRIEFPFEQPYLIPDLELSPQEFNRRFRGSAVKRAKRRGYLRNITVALGNLGDTPAIPQLVISLNEDIEPLVRGHAAWALGRINGEQARRSLEEASLVEKDSYVLEEIRSALGD